MLARCKRLGRWTLVSAVLVLPACVVSETMSATRPQSAQYDFVDACKAFDSNPIRFQTTHLGRRAQFVATVASFHQSGGGFWIGVHPRSNLSDAFGATSYELMGSLFFVSVPMSAASGWSAGDFVSVDAKLSDVRATFEDRIMISGSTLNGFGYVSGGSVKVRTIVWSFSNGKVKRLKTVQQIVREGEERAKLEARLLEAHRQRLENQVAFRTAVQSNDVERMRALIAVGVDYRRDETAPYLHQAAEAESYSALRLLLRLPGIDVNEKTTDGDSALQIAIRKSNVAIIKLLKEAGAKENTK